MSARRLGCLAAIIVVVAVLAATVRACTQGERLIGPSEYVQNDSGRAILLRIRTTTWAVGINEIATLKPQLSTSAIGTKVTFEIVDAQSCQVVGMVLVDFGSFSDPWITLPASGSATVREGGNQPQQSFAPDRRFADSEATPDPCAAQPPPG